MNAKIVLDGVPRPILRYEVWWAVPGKGLFKTLADAMPHGTTFLPAPVAVGEGDLYELLPPELS